MITSGTEVLHPVSLQPSKL